MKPGPAIDLSQLSPDEVEQLGDALERLLGLVESAGLLDAGIEAHLAALLDEIRAD